MKEYVKRKNRIKDQHNLSGKQIGRLTVLKLVEKPEHVKSSGRYWLCKCSCKEEKEVIVAAGDLSRDRTKSCGCLNKESVSLSASFSNKNDAVLASARAAFKYRYRDGNLTLNDFLKISQLSCYYCGVQPENNSNVFRARKKIILFLNFL